MQSAISTNVSTPAPRQTESSAAYTHHTAATGIRTQTPPLFQDDQPSPPKYKPNAKSAPPPSPKKQNPSLPHAPPSRPPQPPCPIYLPTLPEHTHRTPSPHHTTPQSLFFFLFPPMFRLMNRAPPSWHVPRKRCTEKTPSGRRKFPSLHACSSIAGPNGRRPCARACIGKVAGATGVRERGGFRSEGRCRMDGSVGWMVVRAVAWTHRLFGCRMHGDVRVSCAVLCGDVMCGAVRSSRVWIGSTSCAVFV
jgi:hypothetical protein